MVVNVLSRAGDQFPVIPSLELVGNSLIVSPSHTESIAANEGVVIASITTVIVADRAHCPGSGVNVYSVVNVLLIAGLQVPEIPSFEVETNINEFPLHTGSNCVKLVVVACSTTTVIVAFEAHCPAVGVNVYSVVNALSTAGDQVPVMPSLEVDGNVNVSPSHIGPVCVKLGVVVCSTTMVIVVSEAHCPASGVKL